MNDLTGHIGRPITQQEIGDGGHFFGLTQAANGQAFRYGSQCFFVFLRRPV